MTLKRQHTAAWTILAVAFILRIAYLLFYQSLPDWQQLTVDCNFHHHWAQVIAGGNIAGDTTFFRAPLYVYVLGFLYMILGSSLWVGRIFGVVIGTLSVGMTYVLGRRIFDHRTGLIAAGLHAIYPFALYFEQELLVEPLFLLLLQLAVDRLIVWHRTGSRRQMFLTGIALGLAAITRPTALVLVPVVIALVIMHRRDVRSLGHQVMLLAAGLALAIGPVTVRNIAVAGDPTLIASSGGINFYIGNNEESDGVSAVLPPPLGPNWRLHQVRHIAEEDLGRRLNPGEVSTYWSKQATDWILANPWRFATLYGTKLSLYFSNEKISNNRALGPFWERIPLLRYNPMIFAVVLALAVMGLIAGAWRNREVRIILVLMAVYIVAGALFFYSDRFRYPLAPYYLILAAGGLQGLFRRPFSSKRRTIGMVAGGALAAILSLLPTVPSAGEVSTHALTERGLYHFSRGEYNAALKYHRAAARLDPDFPGVNLNTGAAFLELNQLDSASSYLQRELRQHPWMTSAWTNLAYVYFRAGDPANGVELVRQALEREPYGYSENSILLRALFSLDTVPAARLSEEAMAAARRTGDDIYLLNDAAELLINKQMFADAEKLLLRALAAEPPPIESDDEAFRHDFRHSKKNMNTQRARAALQLTYLKGTRNDIPAAIDYARTAIQYDPDLVEGYLNLAAGYQAAGEPAKADSVLREAARRFPDNATVRRLIQGRP